MKTKLVIKVGGALLHNKLALASLLSVLKSLMDDFNLIMVHGGGDTVQTLLEKLQFESHKIDGIRVTPSEQIPYVSGALAGTVNTQLCAAATTQGFRPVGLTLLDGNSCQAQAMKGDFGAVGTVTPADPQLLETLSSQGFLPVVSSIACSAAGDILNINADDAAAAIAQLLNADLILLSDVDGVLDADKQLIAELNQAQFNDYCQTDVIQGGMVVKVRSALDTAQTTQKSVYITSWKTPDGLFALTRGESCGTRIYCESTDA